MDTKSYELYEIVNVRKKGKKGIKIKIKSRENQQILKGTRQKLLKKNRNKRKIEEKIKKKVGETRKRDKNPI